jgi:PAS domain S-box-containing protein
MKDANKTKKQLIEELSALRRRVARLEGSAAPPVDEAHYRSMVEASPVAITVIRNGCILYSNPASARMLGFSGPEEMVGTPVWDIVAPESQSDVAERIKRLEQGKDNPLTQLELVRQDGTRITIESTSVSVTIEGMPTAVIIAQDITERKENEKRSQMMQFSIDHALDRIAWIAPDGHFLYANESACKEMGYTLDEVLSMRVSDVDPNFNIERWAEHYQEVKERGSMRLETQQISDDGQTHDIEVFANYLKFADYEFMCSFGRDITEHKQLEVKLKESQERFKAFMDNIPAAVYIKDEHDRHIYGNQMAFDSVEMKPEDFIVSTTRDLWPAQIAEMLIKLDQKVIEEDVPKITEEWKNTEKGDTRWRRDIKFPIKLESGRKLLGGIAIDITENKRSEQELSEQLEFERLIADIASKLVHTKPEQLEATVDSTLQLLGSFLRTERSFLARFSEDSTSLTFTNTWAAKGIGRKSSIFNLDLAAEIPWVAQQILEGRVFNAGPGLIGLPEEAEDLRLQLQRDGINSGVIVPVQVEGRSIGMLGLDTIVQPRVYVQAIVDRLRIVADIIGSTLQRAQSQKALQESLDQVKQLHSRLEQENIYLHEEIELQHRQGEIIGSSEAVRRMLGQAEQVAGTDSTVLILGETGTGKELLARAIHRMSSRHHRPMITVNCAALPATLIESEMFGREKGAFTGALAGRIGRFEVADGSTIFLDEIGELPPEIQTKLLRVLETGHFERLGSNKTIKVDVRIIAATNRDLGKAVREGSFRRDLFYRLNVFPITVPSLHDRIEDLEQLVWAFVKEYGGRMGKRIDTVPKKSFEALKNCPWRGNIRELRNVIEKSMIVTKGATLNVQLPVIQAQEGHQAVLLKDVEKNHIIKVMRQTDWRVRGKAGAAELLGLKPTTLDARMKKLGIVRPKQRQPLQNSKIS